MTEMPMRAPLLAAALAAVAFAASPPPLAAMELPPPMSGPEFDAATTGRTLTFAVDGTPYGIEQYLPGRRVIWAFIGEECREGSWFDAGPQICFVYDDEPGRLHCWTFHDTETGLFARSEGGSDLVVVEDSDAPMYCPGPDVGA